jgi:hypothetical protein
VDAEELLLAIARVGGAELENRGGKLVIVTRISESLALLTDVRNMLLAHLREYDERRRTLKSNGKRFPVLPPFCRRRVMGIVAAALRQPGNVFDGF